MTLTVHFFCHQYRFTSTITRARNVRTFTIVALDFLFFLALQISAHLNEIGLISATTNVQRSRFSINDDFFMSCFLGNLLVLEFTETKYRHAHAKRFNQTLKQRWKTSEQCITHIFLAWRKFNSRHLYHKSLWLGHVLAYSCRCICKILEILLKPWMT